MIYMLARSFANGGSSLTGIEAVSNAVSALRPPEGRNARQILVTQGSIVAFLIGGISWLSHVTHAIPYEAGYPTVLAQEANAVFGSSAHFMYFVVQAATALILFTGGNTSFSGFPFLASFVAGDSFLPRWLTKRGHRLALSNGIIVLTVVSLILLVATRAQVNGLVPFYAIGVFTGFSIAGFGMAKYHKRVKESGWRRRLVINRTAAIYTAIVVVIFAVVKFTEGAWVIVIIFPTLVFLLIRLNREYRMEAEVLENIGDRRAAGIPARQPNYSRRVVLIFVDGVDLATFAAIRYARGLRPTSMRAVHFVIDSAQAEKLRADWVRFGQDIPLEMIDTPDRRLLRAALELVSHEAAQKGTNVTVVLPRRSYSPLLGRLLHDRTADKIAAVVSQVPNSAAMIIPFDVESRVQVLHARHAARAAADGDGAEEGRVRSDKGKERDHRRRRGAAGRKRGATPRSACRGHAHRRADRAGEGDRRGSGAVGRDPPRRAELRVRVHGRRRHRRTDGHVLRPYPHPRCRAWRAAAAQGQGVHQGRRPGHDQPGVPASGEGVGGLSASPPRRRRPVRTRG